MPAVPYTSLFFTNQLAWFGNNTVSNPNPIGRNAALTPVNVLPFKRIDLRHQSTYRDLINYGNTSSSLIFLKGTVWYFYSVQDTNFTTTIMAAAFNHAMRPKRHLANGYEILVTRYAQVCKGVGSLSAQISEGRGHHPSTTVGARKPEWLPFYVVSKYP